jgi:hypothetical protein
MTDLLLSDDVLLLPNVYSSKPTILELKEVHKAHARLVELNGITREKAGELQATMISAFSQARKYASALKADFGVTKQRLRRIRARIILDEASEVLKTKGLLTSRSPAGSEDLRDSVVNTNEEYNNVAEILAQTEAVMEDMQSRAEEFKMAYYAIGQLTAGHDLSSKRDVSGGTGDDEPGALTQDEKIAEFVKKTSVKKHEPYEDNGFGVPKY